MWMFLAIGALLLLLAIRLIHWLQSRATIPSLHTRYVLVTGCDTGFGRRLVLRLDTMGFHVFAACLTSSGSQQLSSETSERVRTILMDVTNDDDIERAAKEVREALPDGKGERKDGGRKGWVGGLVSGWPDWYREWLDGWMGQ